jgi:hypothetical protein
MGAFCRANNINHESLMACLVVTSMSSILRRHSARVACKQSLIYPFYEDFYLPLYLPLWRTIS